MDRDTYAKHLATYEWVDQFLHWRHGSWHRIDPVDWAAWSNFVQPWAPLPRVGEGEHYFACCSWSPGMQLGMH